MQISEFIGILILQCNCGEKFVVNTEATKQGISVNCTCGRGRSLWGETLVSVHPFSHVEYMDKTCLNQHYNAVERHGHAMPLAEYKANLAEFILNGKVKKLPKQYKNSVSFNENDEAIRNTVEALISLGYKRQDAISKIEIVLNNGCLRNEPELIKAVLAL